MAQTNAPAPLPPAAQGALNQGIIAAIASDYLLAIRFFEEARTPAPAAPLIYLNLGVAESGIPGRELRAIAWFSAYLVAYPAAPNAAAVKQQIAELDVRNHSKVSRLINSVQDAANQIGGNDMNQLHVAQLWAKAGHRLVLPMHQSQVQVARQPPPPQSSLSLQFQIGSKNSIATVGAAIAP